MDRQNPSNGTHDEGISLRMGPVQEMEVDGPVTNGVTNGTNGKRKARQSMSNGKTYKDDSSSDDDVPLVRHSLNCFHHSVLLTGNDRQSGGRPPRRMTKTPI
jgi:hypothetical protein